MVSSKIISGILFITVLFAQTDIRGKPPQSIFKSLQDKTIIDPQVFDDDIVHIPGYSHHYNFFHNNRSVADTLAYDFWSAYFYMLPGDVMMTVYQMPTDGIIKGVNVPVYRWGTGEELTISIHDIAYPYGSDSVMYDQSLVNGSGWLAGYDDDNNGLMELEGINWNENIGMCDSDPMINNARDPFGWEHADSGPVGTPTMGLLWPDSIVSVTLDPTNSPAIIDGGGDNWLNTADYGSEVELVQGDWVGIAVHYSGSGGDGSDPGIGFLYGSCYETPWRSLKFYADSCGGTGGENGWYIRGYVFNFQLAVELTGDRGPIFESVSEPTTTTSTESITVSAQITDDNFTGGDAGVASAQIIIKLDSLTAQTDTVDMTMVEGNIEDGTWEGDIPGQDPGTFVYWKLIAEDVNGNASETDNYYSYFIFGPSSDKLVYFNQNLGFSLIWHIGSIFEYYYYYGSTDNFDFWSAMYGPIPDDLLQHYDVFIELAGGDGPQHINDAEVAEWWSGDKTYIVAGDEWLGRRSAWIDGETAEGSVARNILGIAYEYHDINYVNNGDEHGISRLTPDSTGAANILAGFLADSLLLNYDPYYERGNNNWLDGFEVIDGYTVDMTAYSGVLDSNGNVADDAEIYNVMVHGQAGNGGKSAFMSFDPIALNTAPSYHWVGASSFWHQYVEPNCPPNASPLISVYEALQGIVSIDDEAELPKAFSLKDNYPNPFNPVTNIHYKLHKNVHVQITIYDVLGREVKTLLDAHQTAGEKTIKWNATNVLGQPVSAGVYFYKVEVGDLIKTRKMVLLK